MPTPGEGRRQPASRQSTGVLRTRGGGTFGAARAKRRAAAAPSQHGPAAIDAEAGAKAEAAVRRAWAVAEAAVARAEAETDAAVAKAKAAAEAAIAKAEAAAAALVTKAEADADAAVDAAEAEEERRWWLPALTQRTARVRAKAEREVAKAEAEAEAVVARAEAEAEAAVATATSRAERREALVDAHVTAEAEETVARVMAELEAARQAWEDAVEAAEVAAATETTPTAAAEAARETKAVRPETVTAAPAEPVAAGAARAAPAEEEEEGWTGEEMAGAILSLFGRAFADARPAPAANPTAKPTAVTQPAALVVDMHSCVQPAAPAGELLAQFCLPSQGPAAQRSAVRQRCPRNRGNRRRRPHEIMRRGERARWRQACRGATCESHCGAEEWRGGSPRKGCDARVRMQLQAHGEGPGRTRSGPTSILSRGQLEPNPAMIRG